VVCKDQSEILDAILREYPEILTGKMSIKTLHKSLLQKLDQYLLFDDEANNFIKRFDYCTRFHAPAFSGSYDDLPAAWLDFCEIFIQVTNEP